MNVDEVLDAVADGTPTGHPHLEGQLPLPDPDDEDPMTRQQPTASTAYLRLTCHTCEQPSLTPTADLLVLVGVDDLISRVLAWCANCGEEIDTHVTDDGAFELLVAGISAQTHGRG